MQTLALVPGKSIGPFRLGATREGTRALASGPGFALQTASGRSDYFGDGAAVQVEYDRGGVASFIGANNVPTVYRLAYGGIDLFDAPATDVFELFRALEGETAPAFNRHEILLPKLVVTMWDADEQYDKIRFKSPLPLRAVWGQIGIGSEAYLEVRLRLSGR